MKIAIVVGSIRPGRLGSSIGTWVHEQATAHGGATFDLLELDDFDLSMRGESRPPAALARQYSDERTTAWSKAVDSYDGFVFVTPEYNRSIPAALKNAFDLLSPEWTGKAVGFVAYGSEGGVRAVEHMRQIITNGQMHAVRPQVALNIFFDVEQGTFAPQERRAGELKATLDALVDLTGKLRG